MTVTIFFIFFSAFTNFNIVIFYVLFSVTGSLSSEPQIGTLRESFFASQVSVNSSLYYVDKGYFLVDEKYTFEVGGKNKDFAKIKDMRPLQIRIV